MATFRQNFESLRRRWDLYPWVEYVESVIANGQAVGQVVSPSIQKPYAMLVEDITAAGMMHSINGGVASSVPLAFDLTWGLREGPRIVARTSRAFDSVLLVGDGLNGWYGAGNGLFLEENQELDFTATTTQAIDASDAGGLGGRVMLALRGYRLYPAGSVMPVQRTLEEYKTAGASFDRWTDGVRIQLAAGGVNEISQQYFFDRTIVVTQITVDHNGGNPGNGFLYVSIDSDRPILGELVNVENLGRSPRASWKLAQPLTVKKKTRWTFNAKPDVGFADPTNVDFILHGYELK